MEAWHSLIVLIVLVVIAIGIYSLSSGTKYQQAPFNAPLYTTSANTTSMPPTTINSSTTTVNTTSEATSTLQQSISTANNTTSSSLQSSTSAPTSSYLVVTSLSLSTTTLPPSVSTISSVPATTSSLTSTSSTSSSSSSTTTTAMPTERIYFSNGTVSITPGNNATNWTYASDNYTVRLTNPPKNYTSDDAVVCLDNETAPANLTIITPLYYIPHTITNNSVSGIVKFYSNNSAVPGNYMLQFYVCPKAYNATSGKPANSITDIPANIQVNVK